jgi:hypothetical protein
VGLPRQDDAENAAVTLRSVMPRQDERRCSWKNHDEKEEAMTEVEDEEEDEMIGGQKERLGHHLNIDNDGTTLGGL